LYRNLTVQYFRRAHCVLLVYDVTRRETFENLAKWIEQINDNCPEDTVRILIGNKTDLRPHNEVFSPMEDFVTSAELQKFAEEAGFE
jgi:GTPase SAR1 family protein